MMTFLNFNGIPSQTPHSDKFWMAESPNGYTLKDKDYTYDMFLMTIG